MVLWTNIGNLRYAIFAIFTIFFLSLLPFYFQRKQSTFDYSHLEVISRPKLQFYTDEFMQIGSKHEITKVSLHGYQDLYGLYLGPRRFERLSLLEIGLGCTMRYGPGRSLLTWRDYLPNARISFLEFDRNCAEPFRSRLDGLFIGDQSDFSVLSQASLGGPYDVIVDDGGHSAKQQINSLIGLWPALKNGGIYVIEDLYFWFLPAAQDFPISAMEVTARLAKLVVDKRGAKKLDPIEADLSKKLESIRESLLSVNCFFHACVFVKKF